MSKADMSEEGLRLAFASSSWPGLDARDVDSCVLVTARA